MGTFRPVNRKMKTKCPQCEYIATEHETLDSETNPRNGDISFCINCGEFNEFKNGCLIKTSVPLDNEMKKIRDAWVRTQALSRLK